jgi:hypothetical protein
MEDSKYPMPITAQLICAACFTLMAMAWLLACTA